MTPHDLTPAMQRLLVRFYHAWPDFVPISNIHGATQNALIRRGLLSHYWHITPAGIAFAKVLDTADGP